MKDKIILLIMKIFVKIVAIIEIIIKKGKVVNFDNDDDKITKNERQKITDELRL